MLEMRWSEESIDRLAELAAEPVRLSVDVLVVHGQPGVRATREVTSSTV